MATDHETPADQMQALLAAECGALRRGDLDFVAALAHRKAELLRLLRLAPPHQDARRQLSKLAAESRRHLAAALAGLRAARGRIDAALQGGPLDTYGPSGRSAQTRPSARSVERRA